MKNFIEVTNPNPLEKFLISTSRILTVQPNGKYTFVGTSNHLIRERYKGYNVMETYEEVKALIAAAVAD